MMQQQSNDRIKDKKKDEKREENGKKSEVSILGTKKLPMFWKQKNKKSTLRKNSIHSPVVVLWFRALFRHVGTSSLVVVVMWFVSHGKGAGRKK
jgi:hypothetical protein